MSRARMIKADFWNDEKLSKISRDARLTFIGIWTSSDDYGVVKGNPTWLKNQIYPYEEILQKTFDGWIKELEDIKVIISFDYHKEKYYFIKNFIKHQRVDHPSKNRNPEPPVELLETLAKDSRNSLDEVNLIKDNIIKDKINKDKNSGIVRNKIKQSLGVN